MTPFISKLANQSSLFEFLHDPRYFELVQTYSSWNIYEFIYGKYPVIYGWEDNSFSTNWTYYEEYSTKNAEWRFFTDGMILQMSVSGNAKAYFQNFALPDFNTSEYNYVFARVKGSSNALWNFRLYSQNGELADFPYWSHPPENWKIITFKIDGPLKESIIDQAILAIQSTNNNTATVYVDFYAVFKYDSFLG